MTSQFVVGIDLGTTNTVVAYARLKDLETQGLSQAIEAFAIPQLLAVGEVAPLAALPSALYLAHLQELPVNSMQLPWETQAGTAGETMPVVGEMAKRLGSKTPGRLVTSAKSWLCHGAVDRESAILPWGAPEEVGRVSPVEVTTRVLSHVKNAWVHAFPDAPLKDQEIILTVPASFDEVARELTVKAAQQAGLPRLGLLEEPQAAFYDFVAAHEGGQLDMALGGARLVLVVDVGGGTTDLTLVEIQRPKPGEVVLKRTAVGDHILLGGDNMDLALARLVEQRAMGATGKLDAAQWSQLVHLCRMAKQALLSDKGGPARYGVSVASRGSKLLGGSIKIDLERAEALATLLDGFLPLEDVQPLGRGVRGGGLMELGLPYAKDPAIPRHISAFLWRHAQEARQATGGDGAQVSALPRPDAVLLNGGVFRAAAIRDRLAGVLARWFEGGVPFLPHVSLDAAVARGAVYHGLTRRGLGYRIGGGTARAYYIGIEGEKAICLVPRGFDGTEEITVPRTFALTVGKPARFSLFASSQRVDAVGSVVDVDESMEMLPPIQTVLAGAGTEVPVQLHAAVTDIGTMELSCVSDAHRWKLEFQLRAGTVPLAEERAVEGQLAPSHRGLPEARDWIDRVYGKRPQPVEPRDVKGLFRTMSKVLGDREGWNLATLRELYASTWAGVDRRRRTADHEKLWFQLAGYCLRPGFGAPLDAFRVADLWRIFEPGVSYVAETPNWIEWWVLWRRVAGGLTRAQQQRLFEVLTPYLKPHVGRGAAPKPKGPRAQGREEMVRLVASLEKLEASAKTDVGRWLLHDLELPENKSRSWWALGRVGARVPFHAATVSVVPKEKAEAWLEKLLARDWSTTDGAAFAAAMMARKTDDRALDVSGAMRRSVWERLEKVPGGERWVALVRDGGGNLQAEDQTRMLGETLPEGLRLMDGLGEDG